MYTIILLLHFCGNKTTKKQQQQQKHKKRRWALARARIISIFYSSIKTYKYRLLAIIVKKSYIVNWFRSKIEIL